MAEKTICNDKYKNLLDFAETLYYSGKPDERSDGKFILSKIDELDARRAADASAPQKTYSMADIDNILGSAGYEVSEYWSYVKGGKGPEYPSPLYLYQAAFGKYEQSIGASKEKRAELFLELKDTENIVCGGNSSTKAVRFMPVARGDIHADDDRHIYDLFKDLTLIRKNTYGRNGHLAKTEAAFDDIASKYGQSMAQTLKALESNLTDIDSRTNDIQMYSSCDFTQGENGKAELVYTVHCPKIVECPTKSDPFRQKAIDNESISVKIDENGNINGIRYDDHNLYYDILEVEAKVGNKTILKTGKSAADYIKQNPSEDYPNPENIKYAKVDGENQWIYQLDNYSYPPLEKNKEPEFSKDIKEVRSPIVNDRLNLYVKNVGNLMEKVQLLDRQDKENVIPWEPKSKSVMEKEPRGKERE